MVNICDPIAEEHVILHKHNDKGITIIQGNVNLSCLYICDFLLK